jgi:chromate reductase, NAD(P)H dehydrogenase (quinone)
MLISLFCGSTGLQSANRATLEAAEVALRSLNHTSLHCTSVNEIPIFEPNVDLPVAVVTLSEQFEESDAVLFAIPEYGGGAAGWAKNALDWMVGTGSLYGKVVGITSSGTTGGANSIEQIARTLTWQGAIVVATFGISTPKTKSDPSGRLTDSTTLQQIESLVERLVKSANGTDETRLRFRAETLSPLQIHPDDRRPPPS